MKYHNFLRLFVVIFSVVFILISCCITCEDFGNEGYIEFSDVNEGSSALRARNDDFDLTVWFINNKAFTRSYFLVQNCPDTNELTIIKPHSSAFGYNDGILFFAPGKDSAKKTVPKKTSEIRSALEKLGYQTSLVERFRLARSIINELA
ncbi:hypothetical protein ACFL2B_02040 [Patescibacteria group bacterium]